MSVTRYIYATETQNATSMKRELSTVIFPKIPETESDVYIITKDKDRLDYIAHRYLGDSTLWWIIASANDLGDSFFVTPGIKLRIPMDVQSVLNFVKETNDSR